MLQLQTTLNTLMKVVALVMKILGTKNETELKKALSKMSEVGRTKFIQHCSTIILTGDLSPESLLLAQLLAQIALEEGPEQEYTLMAKNGTSINRYYFGGRVKTYDGNYMNLKKPLNKDLVEGREPIGIYKGKWMYLNGDKIAVPKESSKSKSYDGTAHINRSYHGMLIPKPYKYRGGGFFNKVGDFFSNMWNGITDGVKEVPLLLKKGVAAVGNGVGKGMEWMQKGSNDLNEKYGMDISGALSTLASGLATTFNKPAFNSISVLGDALLTNTPPNPALPDPTTPPNPTDNPDPQDPANPQPAPPQNPVVDNGAPSNTPPNFNLDPLYKEKLILELGQEGFSLEQINQIIQKLTS